MHGRKEMRLLQNRVPRKISGLITWWQQKYVYMPSCYDCLNTLLCESAFLIVVSRVAPPSRVIQPLFSLTSMLFVDGFNESDTNRLIPLEKGTINAYLHFAW
jgi:hypothetical protein